MGNLNLSTFFAVLGALPEAFEKYPHGAIWVGGLIAFALVCHTIVSLNKKRN
jgi:hypothetical protein